MNRSGKRYAQEVHFRRRAVERCGIWLDAAAVLSIIQQIQCGAAKHLEDQSNRVKIKGVKHGDTWLVVAYDKMRRNLITVFPRTSVFYEELT